MNNIEKRLFSLRDEAYASFSSKLIPNIDPAIVIGVRTPVLRTLAGSMSESEIDNFLIALPHKYHEENMLHALLIGKMSSPERIVSALDAFLPFVDDWAVCDCLRLPKLRKRPQELLKIIRRYIGSEHTYTGRFAVEMLMCYFLDEYFDPEYPRMVSSIRSDDYYMNMMLAWYFATALAKQWDAVIPYIENKALSPWVHNKTIQKSCESFRVSDIHKEYLKGLRMR